MTGGLYYGGVVNEETLRSRFDLIEIDGEGILLDRETGGVYRLNRTACEIWMAVMAGQSVGDIIGQLCQRFGLDERQAARDTHAVLQDIPEAPLKPIADPWRWGVTARGYGSFEGERQISEVDEAGKSLRLVDGLRPTEVQARALLKPVAPKLLALNEVFVLHASAVEIDGSLLVFSGRSGAGKTTTAHAFTRTGARLISEDLLVLVRSPDGSRGVASGEAAIRSWISEQAAQLARTPELTIPCEPLTRCVEGACLPLAQILLIDAARRSGNSIQLGRLRHPDALVALLESAYVASPNARHWLARLNPLRDLATGIATSTATVPDGLPALDAAVTAFRQRTVAPPTG